MRHSMLRMYNVQWIWFFFSKKNVAKRNEKDEGSNEILTDGMKSGIDDQLLRDSPFFDERQKLRVSW